MHVGSFVSMFESVQKDVHQNAVDKGFWYEKEEYRRPLLRGESLIGGSIVERIPVNPWNFGEKIALMHSELSEALEKHRKTLGKGLPETPDEHCPEFGGIAIEFADVVIRLMDVSEKMGINLAEAIIAKAVFNTTRPAMHGKAY